MPRAKEIEYCIDENGCFLCTSHTPAPHGYSLVRKSVGKKLYIHRYLYTLAYGSIPKNKELHHTCGNRACINVNHLQACTRTEHKNQHPGTLSRDKRGRYVAKIPCGDLQQ